MNRRSEGALNVLMCAAGMVAAAASAAERPPPPEDGALVAADGTGQFKTIQDAINAAPPNCSQERPWTIRIRAGTYHELVYAQREKHFVRLVGEDPARTTVTFGLCASM
ncbi:MAG: pectinesterase family protein, partial [Opitutaceae bacterium]